MSAPETLFVALISIGVSLLAAYLLVDLLRRRDRLPLLTYRGRTPSLALHFVFWGATLTGTYTLSVAGPLASTLASSSTFETFSEASDAGLVEALPAGSTVHLERLWLPFFERGVSITERDGAYVVREYQAQELPALFLLWSVLYVFLVMRWPSDATR